MYQKEYLFGIRIILAASVDRTQEAGSLKYFTLTLQMCFIKALYYRKRDIFFITTRFPENIFLLKKIGITTDSRRISSFVHAF